MMSELLSRSARDPQRILFLDIETGGSWSDQFVTMIGWAHEGEYRHTLKPCAIDALQSDLQKSSVLVTFNGKQFDVPVLKREFSEISFPSSHIDLMYELRALGHRGGQKAIEVQLGLSRELEIKGMHGQHAPILWEKYIQTADNQYLDLLIRYNKADVINMAYLLGYVLDQREYDASALHALYGKDPAVDEDYPDNQILWN